MDPPEAQLVLGTAGHIDHGKTALIRALTGVDTDRLPEEKHRGITIELGFAPLDLEGDVRLSVVDVPGHEALVRTMVAGATGIDLVLLVVAADEGVMPQTREHVAICDLLGIARGVVALTKIDAVEAEVAELAAGEVAELLSETGLAGAPIVRVCSLTGAGLEELRAQLRTLAGGAPRTPRSGPPRLSIDRAFAAKGFGSVVTGTLVGGAFAVGDAVEIYPSARRARVRGVQSFGRPSERCESGMRCALNLQGIELAELSRGQVVSLPGVLAPTTLADAKLYWLDVAPDAQDSIAVAFLAGTAERRARVAPIGKGALRAGERSYARLHIDGEPVPLLPGDRFIVRGFARTAMGGATLGGGIILDVVPPHRRRSDPALLRDLDALDPGDPAAAVRVRIARSGLAGISREELVRQTGLDGAPLDEALDALHRSGGARQAGPTWLSADAVARLEGRLIEALAAYHQAEPLRPGMPSGALRGRLPENAPHEAVEAALAALATRGLVVMEGDLVRRAEYRPTLTSEDARAAERLVAEAKTAALEPPAPREWARRLRVTPERLRELLAHLEREGQLVHAPGDLWFDRDAIDSLRARVVAYLRTHGRLETPAYKALIGTTRRTAVPLMELFDAERLTLRSDGARMLRGSSQREPDSGSRTPND